MGADQGDKLQKDQKVKSFHKAVGSPPLLVIAMVRAMVMALGWSWYGVLLVIAVAVRAFLSGCRLGRKVRQG